MSRRTHLALSLVMSLTACGDDKQGGGVVTPVDGTNVGDLGKDVVTSDSVGDAPDATDSVAPEVGPDITATETTNDTTPPEIDASSDDELAFQAALALFDAGQYAAARAAFEAFLTNYPASVRADNAAYLIARCAFELAGYAEAESLFDAFITAHPGSVLLDQATYFLGLSRYNLADYVGAATALDALIRDFPTSPYIDNAQYYSGRAYFERTQYATAIARFDAVVADATSAYRDGALLYGGRAHFELGSLTNNPGSAEYTTADTYFKRLFDEHAGSIFEDNARYYYGLTRYNAEVWALAAARFLDMRTRFPESQFADNAWYFEGRCYYKLQDWAKAGTTLDAMAAAAPTSSYVDDATYYAGRSYYESGRDGTTVAYSLGLARFLTLVDDFPESVYVDNAYYYMIRTDLAMNDCTSASQHLDQLTVAVPGSSYIAQAQSAIQNAGCP